MSTKHVFEKNETIQLFESTSLEFEHIETKVMRSPLALSFSKCLLSIIVYIVKGIF